MFHALLLVITPFLAAAWPSNSVVPNDDIMILKPPAVKTGAPAAWIVLPGADIGKESYQPLAETVQRATSLSLWVAVLGTFLMPTTIPPEVGPRIDAALSEMEAQGLDLARVKLFYGGHSLGSVFIQDHLQQQNGPLGGKVQVLGQVLMGGFIQRKYVYPTWTYSVNTLTIGGELDGLARPTRIAEGYYHSKDKKGFPVAIVRGLTHMQFASGDPPMLVQLRDLQPEISYREAHAAIARLVAPYFEHHAGILGAATRLGLRLKDTAELVKPIIAAYEYEGNRYFNAPAQIGGPSEDQCVRGGCPSSSPWVVDAQPVISAVEGWKLAVTNQYVSCSSTPLTGEEFHLPTITNDTSQKTISVSTFTQGYWDDAWPSWFGWKEVFDSFDTGFIATSAEELGSKLPSRQCTLIAGAGQANTPFSVDEPSFCAMMNRKAYDWALQSAGSAARARFEQYGLRYVFGADAQKSAGPLFLLARLQFNEATDSNGQKVVEVVAPAQKTEVDYWQRHFGPIPRPSFLPDPGCYHYCKLLSPARAMEWIYVDSLRLRLSLNSTAGELLI